MKPWAYAVSLLLAWAVLTATCGACAVAIPRPVLSVPAARPAALALEVSVECSGKLSGSGVILSERRALTAAHVVPCGPAALVVLTDAAGGSYPARVAWLDEALDVAVLETTGVLPGPYPVIAAAGEGPVCAANARPARRISCGVVRRISAGTIDHTSPTVFGNSGSGLYDRAGHLIGIVTHRWESGRGGLARALIVEVLP